ncbi:MAG: hypothetical protein Q9216_003601 [Gyalolechia sp. 2 TL-2023]
MSRIHAHNPSRKKAQWRNHTESLAPITEATDDDKCVSLGLFITATTIGKEYFGGLLNPTMRVRKLLSPIIVFTISPTIASIVPKTPPNKRPLNAGSYETALISAPSNSINIRQSPSVHPRWLPHFNHIFQSLGTVAVNITRSLSTILFARIQDAILDAWAKPPPSTKSSSRPEVCAGNLDAQCSRYRRSFWKSIFRASRML